MSGTTRVSRYQKGKNQEGKTNLDFLEQETVSGSGICWTICNAYSLRPPASSPPVGDKGVHLIPHSTHPQSSSLHGAVKAGSVFEIEICEQTYIYYSNTLGWKCAVIYRMIFYIAFKPRMFGLFAWVCLARNYC